MYIENKKGNKHLLLSCSDQNELLHVAQQRASGCWQDIPRLQEKCWHYERGNCHLLWLLPGKTQKESCYAKLSVVWIPIYQCDNNPRRWGVITWCLVCMQVSAGLFLVQEMSPSSCPFQWQLLWPKKQSPPMSFAVWVVLRLPQESSPNNDLY